MHGSLVGPIRSKEEGMGSMQIHGVHIFTAASGTDEPDLFLEREGGRRVAVTPCLLSPAQEVLDGRWIGHGRHEARDARAAEGEPLHPVRMLDGHLQRDRAAKRTADERGPLDVKRVQYPDYVVRVAEGSGDMRRVAETPPIPAHPAIARPEESPLGVPHVALADARVQEDERRSLSFYLHPQRDAPRYRHHRGSHKDPFQVSVFEGGAGIPAVRCGTEIGGGGRLESFLAFDLGSTHLKWRAIDAASGRTVSDGAIEVPGREDGDVADQDPSSVAEAVESNIRTLGRRCGVRRVAFSAAMHSVLAVDADGLPLSGSWTFMDRRAAKEAAALRATSAGARLRELTGVAVDAFSPLVKWCRLQQELPSGARPVALKDFVVHRLTGQWVTDYGTAAASGFLGRDGAWLPEALQMSGLGERDLPRVLDMADVIPSLDGAYEVVVGGTDAALQHLSLGIAMDGSVGALSLGTSGAVRTTRGRPADDARLFSYFLGPGRGYLVGGAFSNMGNLLAWLGAFTGAGVEAAVSEGLIALQEDRKPPLVVPHWFGERTPWWRSDLSGALIGLRPEHEPRDIYAGALLAMAGTLRHGLDLMMEGAGIPITELRGGSGLLHLPGLAPWLAHSLDVPLTVWGRQDASLAGALELAGAAHAGRPAEAVTYEPRPGPGDEAARAYFERIEAAVKAGLDRL